ncbi:MAG: hypothetical protein AAF934_09215 [Bacteroidota bacterium]
MKLFQMMPMQLQREVCQYLAIKFVLVSFLFSCKTSNTNIYKGKETYKIINTVLEAHFLNNAAAYLYPKIIEKQSYIIRDFQTERGYYWECNKTLIKKVFTEEALNTYKNRENPVVEWNYKHIKNPKVITELELKSPSAIRRFEAYKKVMKNKYDLLDRKYLVWTSENSGELIRLSLPFISNNSLYAAVFMSWIHHGSSVWILEKKNRTWKVVCRMELSIY